MSLWWRYYSNLLFCAKLLVSETRNHSCCCSTTKVVGTFSSSLMGNAVESYRAAIGAFYAVTHKLVGQRTPTLNVNILFNLYCVLNIFWLLSIASCIRNDQFKFYKLIILLICMDIHTNPGPTTNDIHSLDIIHLNTRSIRNKMDNMSPVADSFHIACFIETHLDADVASYTLLLDGFDEPLRKDRTQHGGGLMIYMSSMLKYRRRHDLENPIIETLWVEVNFKEINVLICCLYRSDYTASPSAFINELQNSIEIALDYTPYIILTGL